MEYSPGSPVPKLNVLRRKCIDEVRYTFSNTGSRITSPTTENLLPAEIT